MFEYRESEPSIIEEDPLKHEVSFCDMKANPTAEVYEFVRHAPFNHSAVQVLTTVHPKIYSLHKRMSQRIKNAQVHWPRIHSSQTVLRPVQRLAGIVLFHSEPFAGQHIERVYGQN